MKYEWIICFLVTGLMYVSGRFHVCNRDLANAHYEELLKYGNIDIPDYFQDEEELNTTCGNIILSIEYILIYTSACKGGKEFFKTVRHLNYTVLDHIADRLCSEYILLRQANNWDTEKAEAYYSQLEKYMYTDLPLYGKDGEELNAVCREMKETIGYLEMYLDKYTKKMECESYMCWGLINDINSVFIYLGMKDLAEELCDEYSLIRKTYLEIYPCLEENFNHFSTCHNKAKVSSKYLFLIYFENFEQKREPCCASALYRDCITSITEDHCDENATRYVSFVLDNVLGNDTDDICLTSGILCSGPPLPPEEVDPKKKAQHRKEYGKPEHKIAETGEVESYIYEEVTYIYNSNIDKQETISASIISCPVAGTIVVFHFISFMYFSIFYVR